MSDQSDDAQRTLERKALANVRGLLDKLEAEEQERIAGAWKLALGVFLVGLVAVACIAIGVTFWSGGADGSRAQSPTLTAQPAPANREAGAHQKRPKEKFVGARAQEYRFAQYVDNWRQKIERVGNLNYPEEAKARKIYGRLQVTVAIKADGEIEGVEINKSSGYKILDQAALRIVRLAAPFEPFPPNIRQDTDILHITRTWTFAQGHQVHAE